MDSETYIGDAKAVAESLDDFDDEDELLEDDGTLPEGRFLDRELSWLAFNRRVLELAEDPELPVLERANFLAIFASNLDEFFMVRVAGLKRRIATGLAVPTNIGRTPAEVLSAINETAYRLQVRHAAAFNDSVRPALEEHGIRIVRWDSLDEAQQDRLHELFSEQVFPVLMPLAVDPAHPFPYISGLSLNLSVRIRNPKTNRQEFARIKVPQMLPRFMPLTPDTRSGPIDFIALEDLIANQLETLFPGMEIVEHHVFRVTRNEDVQIEEDETENLIQALEKELLRRRFGPPIRLEISDDMDAVTLDLLMRELDITEQEVFTLPSPLDLGGLFDLAKLDRPALHYPNNVPTTAVALKPAEDNSRADIFRSIAQQDILLHHPYESFTTSVQAFLEQAAADPHVLAIKQTLYRTSGDSPIVEALIDAAEAGKQVLALVEIKARFDEQANITWARKLEKAGVHVVYGVAGLKTHCKLALVIRQEKGGVLRHYSHIGTGNYNPKTSRIYEDLGLLTADDVVGKDLTRLFNELSGYGIEKKFKRLLVAPLHLRKGLLKRIAVETQNALDGKPSGIRIKVNSIVDEKIIDALYRASNAGVPVQVWVRGICSLTPGQPGLSENIEVRSILGRYLEHSRVFSFVNDGDQATYIGSADMMHRNLDRPRRGARAARGSRAPAGDRGPVRPRHGRHHLRLDPRLRRGVDAPQQGRGRHHAGGPADRGDGHRVQAQAARAPLSGAPRSPGPASVGDVPPVPSVFAAGAVVWRVVDGRIRVLIIHRTRRRDTSLPKGKVDPGETLPQTAVREVHEETGLRVALGVPLGAIEYGISGGRRKSVSYWAAEATDAMVEAGRFEPDDEVESVEWVSNPNARKRLDYPGEVQILDLFAGLVETGSHRSFALIALRHGHAVQPYEWDGADASRPLSARGRDEVRTIVPTLLAFGPRSSRAAPPSAACRRWHPSRRPSAVG